MKSFKVLFAAIALCYTLVISFIVVANSGFIQNEGVRSLCLKVSDKFLRLNFGSIVKIFATKTEEAKIFIEFSQDDLKFNQDVIDLAQKQEGLLLDSYKKYRNAYIIDDQGRRKIKYKMHGSSLAPYIRGFKSWTIKDGTEKYKVINSFEMDYFNIFLNTMARDHDVYGEDAGGIIIVSDNQSTSDYFKYQVFNEDYLRMTYGISARILRRNTYREGHGFWHSSFHDSLVSNLDAESLTPGDADKWRILQNASSAEMTQAEYMGRFSALLQLTGSSHQITGNNDKWLLIENKFFPVFRNEGDIAPISVKEIIDFDILRRFYYSSSTRPYARNMVRDSSIYYRNLAFKSMEDNRESLIQGLTDLWNENKLKHLRGQFFLKKAGNYFYNKQVLVNNLETLSSYLRSGHVSAEVNGRDITFFSSRKSVISIYYLSTRIGELPCLSTSLNKNLEISHKLGETTIQLDGEFEDLVFVDNLLNDTLNYESDISVVSVAESL